MATMAQSRDGSPRDPIVNFGITGRSKINHSEMIALYEAGSSTKELAERYGVKTPAITRALNACGVKPRKPQQAAPRMDALAELVADGMTIWGASRHLGITEARGNQIWARIRSKLGWQAC